MTSLILSAAFTQFGCVSGHLINNQIKCQLGDYDSYDSPKYYSFIFTNSHYSPNDFPNYQYNI